MNAAREHTSDRTDGRCSRHSERLPARCTGVTTHIDSIRLCMRKRYQLLASRERRSDSVEFEES